MLEKYETPEVEFVEMEEDVIVASNVCGANPVGYGDNEHNCYDDGL